MSKQKAPARRKQEELLEIVDGRQRPLGAFPRSKVHEFCLMHKSVAVLLYNRENKMYLQRRSRKLTSFPGYWDLSAAGHVRFGEAFDEAAYRELEEELGINQLKVYELFSISAGAVTGYEFVTIYATEPSGIIPAPNVEEVSEGLFVEKHELAFLIKRHPGILTPSLIHFWNLGCLFTARS